MGHVGHGSRGSLMGQFIGSRNETYCQLYDWDMNKKRCDLLVIEHVHVQVRPAHVARSCHHEAIGATS